VLDLLFYTFTFVVFIQSVYYGFIFSKFAFAKTKSPKQKNIAVSVIIYAKNDAEHLQKNLPFLIEQDYQDFEIILVNDTSNDDTLEVMEQFKAKFNRIKIVNVKPIEAFWGSKKYALTLGIKAASHDFLILTDPECNPASRFWIQEMSSHFSNTKHLVLGHISFNKQKYNLFNKLVRFENLINAIQYLSFAKLGIPYKGVGKNLGYRKEMFFKANGFMNHMEIPSGEDALFVNQMANSKNTAICISKNSFTKSKAETSFINWINTKRGQVLTARHYKSKHRFLLSLFHLSQLLFWSLSIALLIFLFKWEIVVALIVLRIALQYISIGSSAKKLNETDLLILLPLLEIFLILSQLAIFITNLISKPRPWK